MKPRNPHLPSLAHIIAACTATAICCHQPARAGNVYWDTNGSTADSSGGTTANGTWNMNSTGNWSTDSAGLVSTTDYTTASGTPSLADVVFSAGANATGSTTITLDADNATSGIVARGITVEEGAIATATTQTGSLIGPLLTLGSGGITLTATANGASSFNSNTSVGLSASQSWTNANTTAANTFTAAGAITSTQTSGTTTLTLAGANTGTNTISGIIGNGTSGATVAIAKSDAGTWLLSNANTYSGGTTVSAGKLLVGNGAGAGTGTITLNGGTFGASGGQTITNRVVVTTGNSATIGGGTGTLTLGGTLTGGGELQLTTNALVINGNVASNFTGSITSSVEIQTTSANNTVPGFQNLANAAVTLQSGGGFRWSTGGSTAQTAVFALGSLAGTAGTLGLSSGSNKTDAFVIGSLNTNTTYGGTIVNGNGGTPATSVTKVGSGMLTLNGAAAGNTMTGGITIRGGTLRIGDGSAAAGGFSTANNALTFADTGTFNYMGSTAGSSQGMAALTFAAGAGTLQSTNNGGTASLTFSSLATRTAGATGNFVVSGGTNGSTNKIVLTGAAAGSLLSQGLYFGGADFAAYDTGGFVRALSYGTDTNAAAVDMITSANHVKLTATPAGQSGISLLTLNLAGSGVSWAQNASQTLTLSGGGLIKSGGGSGATISGGTAVTTGGATELVIRTDLSDDSLDIQTNITSTSTGGLTKSGAGTLTLSAASNAYTGATRVNEGTMLISGGYSGSSAFTVNNSATLTITGAVTSNQNATFNMLVGNRAGNGVLNVNSGGTLTLAIGNFNTALAISNSNAGSDAGSGTVNVAGTLNTNGDITVGLGGTQNGTLNISNGGIVNIGTSTLRWMKIGQFDTVSGTVNLAAGGALNLNFNSDIRFSTDNGGGTNVFNQSGNVTVWSGNGTGTTGSASDGMVDLQQGTSTTLANNTYNLNGGTLLVNRVTSTGTTGTRTFNFNGGTLKAFSASAATFFNLGTGNSRANVRNGGALIDTNGFNATVAQALLHSNISGDNATDGGLAKSGAGTLTLSGTNTYNGATTVTAGKLLVSGSIGNSAVTVSNTGTTLASGANGTIGSGITINSGAILTAGDVNSVGKATIGSGTSSLASGSIFSWDLASNKDTDDGTRGTHYDALDTGGTLTVDSGAIFRVVLGAGVIADTFWQSTQSWSNIFSGPLSGAFSNNLLQVVNSAGATYNQDTLNPGSGYGFTINGSTLTWSAVPETSNALIGGLLGLALLRRRRK